ncbi:PREDICTED: dnaJ homolog subfamily B member 6 [Tarenaya hassleriana]|uniref:dnaJ homolog subfamily B member 6 n=1 Tax=Tarenaya hassleriana TaxID=28532 RepID=UPI00053C1735|nr:PREDICTED: dnaJ homolog subfamily B member 6 [Tarenaya hassleriana]
MSGNGGEKNNDNLYAVLGLKKECTVTELRSAYKKLALRWHPDRCSSSGNTEYVEEAKKKFQAIQQAYSVLSDSNKRFLYDVGAYDSDDDDQNGMGDFLSEMATMMSKSKPNGNAEESFEQLQELFHEMFNADTEAFRSSSSRSTSTFNTSCSVSFDPKDQHSSETSSERTSLDDHFGFEARPHSFFSLGVEHQQDFKKGKAVKGGGDGRRNRRKHKVSSSGHDVSSSSSNNYGVPTS